MPVKVGTPKLSNVTTGGNTPQGGERAYSIKDTFGQTTCSMSNSCTPPNIIRRKGSQDSFEGLIMKNHNVTTTSQMFSINEKIEEGGSCSGNASLS